MNPRSKLPNPAGRFVATVCALMLAVISLTGYAVSFDFVDTCPEISAGEFVSRLDEYLEADLDGDTIKIPPIDRFWNIESGDRFCHSENQSSPYFVVDHLYLLGSSGGIWQFFVWRMGVDEATKLANSWFSANSAGDEFIVHKIDAQTVIVISASVGGK